MLWGQGLARDDPSSFLICRRAEMQLFLHQSVRMRMGMRKKEKMEKKKCVRVGGGLERRQIWEEISVLTHAAERKLGDILQVKLPAHGLDQRVRDSRLHLGILSFFSPQA